jgi:parallel beta-helix repeat protein
MGNDNTLTHGGDEDQLGVNGFFLNGDQFSSLNLCTAKRNSGTTGELTGGIFLQSCLGCVLAADSADDNSQYGISLLLCTECHVEKSIAKSNNGTPGFGFADQSSTNDVFFGNQAQGNVTNYLGVNQIVTYDVSTGLFSATPTPYSNIDIVP